MRRKQGDRRGREGGRATDRRVDCGLIAGKRKTHPRKTLGERQEREREGDRRRDYGLIFSW